MKVVEINAVPYGSTMKIVLGVYSLGKSQNIDFLLGTGYSYHPLSDLPSCYNCFSKKVGKIFHILFSYLTGMEGGFSHFATRRFLQRIKTFKPDIIHLHNLHGSYINIPMLFKFAKKNHVRIVWTLHDCWAFTGHCPYFTMVDCDKWKTGCYKCPQYREYPWSLFDNSKKMYRMKRKWFTGIKDMTIVTPSQWLAGLVKQSFLKDYPVKVINNGIDLSVFKPTESDFREKHGIRKYDFVLLGVAFGWGKRKGLDVFIELARKLPENYKIVLVGTDDKTNRLLPKSIISIHRTQNQTELAEIYTAADVFVNPTREDNYPTVNMESIACGTPVITFDTGGSPECIDKVCGSIIPCDDVDSLKKEILHVCEQKLYSREDCIKKAKNFDEKNIYNQYLDLFYNNGGNII